jgi:hypothetical protein
MLAPGPQQSEALRVGSSAHGMLPLHIVVAFDAVKSCSKRYDFF